MFESNVRARVLGLSMDDFKSWVIREKIASEVHLASRPGLLSELASNDKVWEQYEISRECRYIQEMSQDQVA